MKKRGHCACQSVVYDTNRRRSRKATAREPSLLAVASKSFYTFRRLTNTRKRIFHCPGFCFALYKFAVYKSHRSATYVDAAYCYRPSSVVTAWSVCHISEPCKMAEPIEMLFGLRTQMSRRTMC